MHYVTTVYMPERADLHDKFDNKDCAIASAVELSKKEVRTYYVFAERESNFILLCICNQYGLFHLVSVEVSHKYPLV